MTVIKVINGDINMSNIAILGHPTRGKEVIEILEMLGGNNKYNFRGDEDEWFILNRTIQRSDRLLDEKGFTLEEFLEKFPYKVGDKVEYKSIGDANLKSKIIYMEWCNSLNKVLYTTEDAHVISTEDITETKAIPPYMDYDIKEDKGTLEQIDLTRELRIADEVEVILGDYEFVLKDGKTYFVKKKPQYPKTYEECCKILGIEDRENGYCGYEYELLGEFQKLYICRDAYWKIAGEQMGLGKPWKPDWNNVSDKHCIYFVSGEIWLTECQTRQCTLAFPTAEMRDKFYEKFKELIEFCKELL